MSGIEDIRSFLDIQYAWENAGQQVLFVPEMQLTDENIKKFNERKREGWHLAAAASVYQIKDSITEIFTGPIFQHGYYDLLLHGDYRVVPYALRYPGKEQPHRMTSEEFKQAFVWNERRSKLYHDLTECLGMVKSRVEISSVKVGGSFVESKELPGDMDLVLFISAKEFEKIGKDKELYEKYRILTTPYLMKSHGLELHVRVFAEEEVDLNSNAIYSEYETVKYICERGYLASLYTNGHEVDHIRYLHNFVGINERKGE